MDLFKDLRSRWWLWVLAGAGILLLVIGTFSGGGHSSGNSGGGGGSAASVSASASSPVSADSSPGSDPNLIAAQLDKQLESMLGRLPGVKNPQVLITWDSGSGVQYAHNQQTTTQTTNEKDQNGAQRTSTSNTTNEQIVTSSGTGGGNTPVIERTLSPNVRGALVMAEGADDPRIQEEIVDAISTVLGIPAFKVSVQPEK